MTLTRSYGAGVWPAPSFSIDTFNSAWIAHQSGPGSAVTWGVANRAVYVPVRVPRTGVVLKLAASVGATSTGNIDIGLYNTAGTRLVSSGSVTKLSSQTQVRDVTDTTIGPGLYYLALNNSTTTDSFHAWNEVGTWAVARGVLTEALGSVTLPDTATWAIDQTLTVVPIISALLVTELA